MNLPETKWSKYYSEAKKEYDENRTLYQVIKDSCDAWGDRVALEYGIPKLTYSQLYQMIEATAKSLVKLGVKKGDVITVTHNGLPATVALIYAASKIGAIVSLVNNAHSVKEIEEYIWRTKSLFLFVSGTKLAEAKKLFTHTDKTITVVTSRVRDYSVFWHRLGIYSRYFVDDIKSGFLRGMPDNVKVYDWKKFMSLGNEITEEVLVEIDYNAPAVLFNYGVAGGSPNMVEFSSRAINQKVQSLSYVGRSIYKNKDQIRVMSCIKMSFPMGLALSLHAVLAMGNVVTLYPNAGKASPDVEFLKCKPDVIIGYNSVWDELMDSPALVNADLSFLKAAISGGELMTGVLYNEFSSFLKERKSNALIYRVYGITESLSAVCGTSQDMDNDRLIGIPFPGVIMKIMDRETGHELPIGSKGEIAISYNGIMSGYYRDPIMTSEVIKHFQDGRTWLFTGDLGKENERGEFIFEGHLRRVVQIQGTYVYPEMVENEILNIYGVENCCVVPVNNQGVTSLTAIVVPIPELISDNDRLEELTKEINDYCSQIFYSNMCPTNIEFRVYMPKTLLGVNDYEELERQLNSRFEEISE
ncbi:MAG: acyl--CoA ligase [Saccharofermentans sp.]|nr:acyl--CoA ligase [Saccharofermentans sp.]